MTLQELIDMVQELIKQGVEPSMQVTIMDEKSLLTKPKQMQVEAVVYLPEYDSFSLESKGSLADCLTVDETSVETTAIVLS